MHVEIPENDRSRIGLLVRNRGLYSRKYCLLLDRVFLGLDFFDISEPHKTSLSLLTGFSGALDLHTFITVMDK